MSPGVSKFSTGNLRSYMSPDITFTSLGSQLVPKMEIHCEISKEVDKDIVGLSYNIIIMCTVYKFHSKL